MRSSTKPPASSGDGWSGRFSAARVTNVWSRQADIKSDDQASALFAVSTEDKDRWIDPDESKVYHDNYAPVWRWRQAMSAKFNF